LSVDKALPGTAVTIFGSNFTPGTQVILQPGGTVIGTSLPTVVDEITFTVPSTLANIKYSLFVDNGEESIPVEFSILRNVSISTTAEADILLGGFN
jgi:hypothetical protein